MHIIVNVLTKLYNYIMSSETLSVEQLRELPLKEQLQAFAEINIHSSREEVVRYGGWLSVHYAEDGNPVSPNSTIISRAHEEYPVLPSRGVIYYALGSIKELPEAVGFLTQRKTANWTREDYLTYGHWLSHMLGSAEAPVAPSTQDILNAVHHHIGPSTQHIVKMFNGISGYQDALGFVSETTQKRWTDAEWIQWGHWLSHMLGSAESPVTPTEETIIAASKAKIGPTIKSLQQKFGNVTEFQKALGLRLNYENWDRATFIEHGKWFSHLLGSPEKPVMPTSRDLTEGSPHLLSPPGTAITKRFRSISAYQDALGFVTTATLKRWKEQDWIDNGRWLGAMLAGEDGIPVIPRKEDIIAAADLRLTPRKSQITARYGTYTAYQKALGFHSGHHYRSLSKRDLLRHGMQLIEDNNGVPPASSIYDAADGPTHDAIGRRFGTLGQYHERLGFPDFRHFTDEQLVNFGIHWMREKGKPPTRAQLDELSLLRQAPSSSSIQNRFTQYTIYKHAVEAAYHAYSRIWDALLMENPKSQFIIELAMKDFQNTPEFIASIPERLEELQTLQKKHGANLLELYEFFAKSRTTIHWEESDFVYFRSIICHKRVNAKERVLGILEVLDRYGLSPYLDEIEEVFGSLEEFALAA